MVDEVGHGALLHVLRLLCVMGKRRSTRIEVLGVHVLLDRRYLWNRRAQGMLGGDANFFIDRLFETRNRFGIENAVTQQEHLKLGKRIAQRVGIDLCLAAIKLFIVRQ